MFCGRRCKCLYSFIVGCGLTAVAQTNTTIQVPLNSGDFVAIITFDENRHAAEDVKRWMELSKEGSYSEPRHAVYLCDSNGASEYLPQYRSAIDETAQLVKELDPSDYPQELSDVVTYLRHLQTFWLWLDQEQLEFLTVGRTPATKWEDIDTGPRCNWTLAKLRRVKNPLQKCKEVIFDWSSCVNKEVQLRLGTYPEKAWDSFLRSQGLQVEMLSDIGD
jgi:hypothetical protein